VSIPINIIKPSVVHFTIYDVGGSVMFSSNRGYNSGVENKFFWDGKNNNGQLVSSGNYYISAANNTFNETRKVLYIK
jgi:flagellar hook assembly protein FlgD